MKTIPVIVLGMLLSFAGLKAQTVIKIGVENISYYPHYSVDKGEYTGFARALLDSFAKKHGYVLEYQPLPLKRLYAKFTSGELDLKYPDNSYWAQEAKKDVTVVYSEPVVSYIDGIMVKPKRFNGGITKLKTLGTVLGFTPYEYLEMIGQGKIQVIENPSFTGLLMQTIGGRVDGAYVNVDVAKFALNELIKQPDELVFDPSLPNTQSYYHLSTIAKPELIKVFNAWMHDSAEEVVKLKARFNLR